MSSHLHSQFFRVRHCAAAAAAGLMIAFAIPAAPAADHTQSLGPGAIAATTALGPRATPPDAVPVGSTSRASSARMRALEAQGYVPIECLRDGTLMLNPRTHRTAKVLS